MSLKGDYVWCMMQSSPKCTVNSIMVISGRKYMVTSYHDGIRRRKELLYCSRRIYRFNTKKYGYYSDTYITNYSSVSSRNPYPTLKIRQQAYDEDCDLTSNVDERYINFRDQRRF